MPQAGPERLPEWVGVQPLFRWRLPLAERELTLCLLDLDAPGVAEDLLQEHEQARASRFKQAIHAQRHRRSRTLMRSVLGDLTAQPPLSLRLQDGPHGKPELAPTPADGMPTWHFNLSHSGPWALLAAWQGPPLGVDLEVRDVTDVPDKGPADDDAVARRIMTPAEHAQFSLSPPEERTLAFLRTWTRKEACLKALGVGFQLEPHRLSLNAQPMAPWPHGDARISAPSQTEPPAPILHPGPIHWVDLAVPAGCPLVAACAWLPG